MLHFFSHKGVQKECNTLQEVARVYKRKKRQARQNDVFSSAPMSPVKQWSKGVGGSYYLVCLPIKVTVHHCIK